MQGYQNKLQVRKAICDKIKFGGWRIAGHICFTKKGKNIHSLHTCYTFPLISPLYTTLSFTKYKLEGEGVSHSLILGLGEREKHDFEETFPGTMA